MHPFGPVDPVPLIAFSRSRGGLILVIDSDPAVARALRRGLASAGYTVRHTRTGAGALSFLEHASPDLIVLDLRLPDVDGLILCSRLVSEIDVPIIVCSASSERRDRVLALTLGADDYIRKPFDMAEFEARVQAILRRTRPEI
jgi:DNA-binding response OmpR family regulator